MVSTEKLIDGLGYVLEVLNTTPITGVENCQKFINATINIKVAIASLKEIQNEEQEKINESIQ